MNFRHYQAGDFEELYAIEMACFQPPLRFTKSYMRQILQHPNGAAWVAEDDGVLIGFGIVEWEQEEGELIAYIETLEVSSEFRRKGIGLKLLRLLEGSSLAAGASMIWLHVDSHNKDAKKLYFTSGYENKGAQQNYYGNRHDAEIYCKVLSASSIADLS